MFYGEVLDNDSDLKFSRSIATVMFWLCMASELVKVPCESKILIVCNFIYTNQ